MAINEHDIVGVSNFQVLLGHVELGPLSQRPELFKVAAVHNESVNVTDDRQTAVVTAGVNIRLDWSNWVNEVLGSSITNASYTFYRTQLDELGSATEPSEVLKKSKRIIVKANEDFFVEISSVLAVANESDRANFELEARVPETSTDESRICYESNITVFSIERPNAISKT